MIEFLEASTDFILIKNRFIFFRITISFLESPNQSCKILVGTAENRTAASFFLIGWFWFYLMTSLFS